jgi:hypothetical protein
MFSISADQAQWFHLYRVQKTFPTMFVILCAEEINSTGNSTKYLDLRIISTGQTIMGNSWCVKSGNDYRKQVNRADCTKFLELRAKHMIAATMSRGIDQVELTESSQEEAALAMSFDETLRSNFAAIATTLYSKMARDLVASLEVNHTGIVFEEMSDWPTRNREARAEQPAPLLPEPLLIREPVTTKTQRVPV